MKKIISLCLLAVLFVLFSCAGNPPAGKKPSDTNMPEKPFILIYDKEQRVRLPSGSVVIAEVNFPNGYTINITIAEMTFKIGKGTASEKDFTEYDALIAMVSGEIEKNPLDASSYLHRASAFYERGRANDLDLAIRDCDTALKIDGSIEAAYYIRGMASAAKGDFQQAESDMVTIMNIRESNSIGIMYVLARTYHSNGKTTEAIEMMENVIKIDPDFLDAIEVLDALRGM